MIGAHQWRPSGDELEQTLGRPTTFANSFSGLLFSLSLRPAGSVKMLSLAGYAPSTVSFSFSIEQHYLRLSDMWIREADVQAEPPFQSIRMSDLLSAPSEITLPNNTKVQLKDLRKSFAADAVVRLFNLGNPLQRDFIQVLANFFQLKTTAFTDDPIQLIPEEIGVSDEDPPRLLKSFRFGFGYAIGEPLPARTVARMEDLLDEPAAFTAFPRRA